MNNLGKKCPQCGALTFLDAPVCACGHQFRTNFGYVDQTQMYGIPQQPPPNQPPPQGQPTYQQTYSHLQNHHNPNQSQQSNFQQHVQYDPYGKVPGMIQFAPRTHSAMAAIVFQFLLVGAGMLFNRQYAKGVVFMGAAVIVGMFGFAADHTPLIVIYFLLWFIGLIDVGMIGGKLERGEAVREWQFF